MFKIKTKTRYLLLGLSLLILPFFALASEEEGVIDDTYQYIYSENTGWIDFKAEDGNVVVKDGELTGYAFGENIGWISLNCSNDDSCGNVDYKVSNDGNGNLSGYAWGENMGWIDFDPENSGVVIDTDGNFSGYAYGENIGWLSFSCENDDSCNNVNFKLSTDWRPESERQSDLEIDDVKHKKTDTTITIKWETNSKANSRVRWGEDKNLENEKKDSKNEKEHKIKLKNLKSDTRYYFRIKSTDENGNVDRSKTYQVKTDEQDNFFQALIPSVYEKADQEEKFEDLKIDVSDKRVIEEGEEEVNDNEKQKQEKQQEEIQNIEKDKIAEKKESKFKNFFIGIKNKLINAQDKIASIFSGEKEKTKEYFTARIAQVSNKKIISNIKFQILDKQENPISEIEATLFSDPKTTITDENGIASFEDVPIGEHTLVFVHNDEKFEKDISIQDTQIQEGVIRAEVIQVKAEKERIAFWMWFVIFGLILFLSTTVYFGRKYYKLRNNMK